jgi:hypothetical protein
VTGRRHRAPDLVKTCLCIATLAELDQRLAHGDKSVLGWFVVDVVCSRRLSCLLLRGADTNTTPAATTGVFPLSTEGDGEIDTTVALPSTCLAPIVLVNFAKGSTLITTRYIALTGFTT